MAQTIGLRIGLEGENDFKSQLRDINQELRVCESQMRLTSASFDGNNDSIDALNARYSDLGTTSQAQRDKIELLRQALTNASESFGENDSRTRAWQIQLNNATTELTRTENEMRSTETALQGLNTAEQHAGDNAEELGRDLSTAANHTDELADGVRDVGNETENTGKSFTGFKEKLSDIGKKVGEFALIAGKAMIDVSAKVASVAFDLGKQIVSSYAELEQNIGGSEAVFREFADDGETIVADFSRRLQKLGENAYKNMGTSQSQYLATANKMGALFQGTGLDIEKSFDLTTEAMQRAADMSSVMGIDIQVALDSVAGAAKGNFTMMDNIGVAMNDTAIKAYAAEKGLISLTEAEEALLKINIEGAKFGGIDLQEFGRGVYSLEEMRTVYNQLVKDSLNFSGEVSVNSQEALEALGISFLDLQQKDPSKLFDKFVDGAEKAAKKADEAGPVFESTSEKVEVAMQMFLDKTSKYSGNFAEEATQTVSGSFGLLSASYESLLAGIGNSDADLTKLVGNVAEALNAVIQNITPIIQNIIAALPTLFDAIISAVTELLPTLIPLAQNLILSLISAISENLPMLIESAVQIIQTLINGILEVVPQLSDAAVTLLSSLSMMLFENLPIIVDAALKIIITLANGIASSLPVMAPQIVEVVMRIAEILLENLPLLVEMGVNIIAGIAEGIISAGAVFFDNIRKFFDDFINFVKNIFGIHSPSTVFSEFGTNLIQGLINGITGLAESVKNLVTNIASGIIDGIKNIFGGALDVGKNLINNIGSGISSVAETVKNTAVNFGTGAFNVIKGAFANSEQLGSNLVNGIGKGISSVSAAAKSIMVEVGNNIIDGAKNAFSGAIDIGKNLLDGLSKGVKDNVSSAVNTVKDAGSKVVSGLKNLFGINSPSRVFAEIGMFSSQGLGIGFVEEMQKVNDDIHDSIDTDLSGLRFELPKIMSNIDISSQKYSGVTANSMQPSAGLTVNFYNNDFTDKNSAEKIMGYVEQGLRKFSFSKGNRK